MKSLEKVGAKLVSDMTTKREFGWPPTCTGLIYQPERPVTARQMTETSEPKHADELDK